MRANILLDEQFKNDIQAIKQKAEQGFVSVLDLTTAALKNKAKLRKEKGKTIQKGTSKTGSTNKTKQNLLSADVTVKTYTRTRF